MKQSDKVKSFNFAIWGPDFTEMELEQRLTGVWAPAFRFGNASRAPRYNCPPCPVLVLDFENMSGTYEFFNIYRDIVQARCRGAYLGGGWGNIN